MNIHRFFLRQKIVGTTFIIFSLIIFSTTISVAEIALLPSPNFYVVDTPSDTGGSLTIAWTLPSIELSSLKHKVLISTTMDGPFHQLDLLNKNFRFQETIKEPWWARTFTHDHHYYHLHSTNEFPIHDGNPYWIKMIITNESQIIETPTLMAIPKPNFFNWALANNLILLILFAVTVLISIRQSRKNPHRFLRRIPGLDAVEEAIGRATEMGKPILYLTGSASMDNPSTIAATVVLSEVAKKVSTYETELIVPHRDPIVLAICQEITKEAYTQMGHPDAYKPESNFFITDDQFSYTAAVQGIMLRERPAAIFLLGYYYAESLLLAETGHEAGAIQIAGTDADHQLPFFVIACDYTLMGEELYAASAYLSREPVLVGTLRAQDIGKGVLLFALAMGTLLVTAGEILQTELFTQVMQFFYDFK